MEPCRCVHPSDTAQLCLHGFIWLIFLIS